MGESKSSLSFEIKGKDFENLQKFKIQHENCKQDISGGMFAYTFSPTGLGLAITVNCSCGQHLLLGNFMDHEEKEYDEEDHKVLSKQDIENQKFEEEAQFILQLKDPRIFRMGFRTEQKFDVLYAYALGIATAGDKRLSKIFPYVEIRNSQYKETDNEKIEQFYKVFEQKLRDELSGYGCTNKRLLERLGMLKAEQEKKEYSDMYAKPGRHPIMVLHGEAAQKILDKPKKGIPNRHEVIRKAKDELEKFGDYR